MVLSLLPGNPFRHYFGAVHPLVAVALITIVGALSLRFLVERGWFQILSTGSRRRGLLLSAGLATLFAAIVVPADFLIRFPQDMNVPLPQSLLFYPVIGYVVELVFHALPLALLLWLLGPLQGRLPPDRLVWLCIPLVAVLEPLLQMGLGFSGQPLSWAQGFVAVHVFAFNLAQLAVFRRYDFVSMYVFRLVYYLYWHILWGSLRLFWLF